MKRLELASENRRMYTFDSQYPTDLPTEGSIRTLKTLGAGYKGLGEVVDYNDHRKMEPAFLSTNIATNLSSADTKPQTNNRKGSKEVQDSNDYRSLNEKLNVLEHKILRMKSNIDRKREDKKEFLAQQQRERQERERRREEASSQRESSQRESSAKKPATQAQPALRGLVTQVPQQKDLKYFDSNPYSPRSSVYYVSEVAKAYKEERSIAREHLISSMQLLRTMEASRRNAPEVRPLSLAKHPNYKDKKTIVFDLDETLIHCNENLGLPYDVKLPVRFPTGELVEAGINVRPYARELLRNLAARFELVVFTASHSCYANVVLDYLDPEGLVQHRLFREHCLQSPENVYVKDLRVLGRPLSDVVLVDNAAYSYAYQVDNGVPVLPFYDAKHDFELVALERYLQGLLLAKDVRDVNRSTFKLHLYHLYDDVGKLVRDLYLDPK